jgi:catechol 2,3-dioxygenase-like lactoylglutathione lyase family enzyme
LTTRITDGHTDAARVRGVRLHPACGLGKAPVVEPNPILAYTSAEQSFEKSDVRKDIRSMIAYVTVGADDIARAKRFYSAFLPALGYELHEGPEGLSYALPLEPGQSPILPDFYVKQPFDGAPASVGNGSMVAFEARSQEQVRNLHAAALDAGGSDEGKPGFRASYGPHFYVGYLRDPQGNKIALFSSDPNEPGRDTRHDLHGRR